MHPLFVYVHLLLRDVHSEKKNVYNNYSFMNVTLMISISQKRQFINYIIAMNAKRHNLV